MKYLLIKIVAFTFFFSFLSLGVSAQESIMFANNQMRETKKLNAIAEEPNYTLMAQRDARKYFSVKKPLWTGIVCGFIPVVGWVAAPIIAVTHKLEDQQMWNPANNNNHLRESNSTYKEAYRKYCVKKRSKNFVFGFGVSLASLAGYYLATNAEYIK